MTVHRSSLVFAAAAALLVALAFTTLRANAHLVESHRPVQIRVYSRQPWTSTSIYLHQGESIKVRAGGSVSWQPHHRRVGPTGLPFNDYLCASAQYSGSAFQAPGINCWSLMARIGQIDVPFFVGSSFHLKSPSGGRLYLGFNDDTYSDNSGSFKVTVTLR
ncbi:MAG TPA: hypothetical protein VFB34_09525 [Chloroflexota bacterium]|nr:hypothetical protein [Chloroflexota bacterium]